jgi:hypothetical protein
MNPPAPLMAGHRAFAHRDGDESPTTSPLVVRDLSRFPVSTAITPPKDGGPASRR